MEDIKIGVAQIVALSDKVNALENYAERMRVIFEDVIKHFGGDLADEEETARVLYEHNVNRVRVDVVGDYLLQIAEEIKSIGNIVNCIERGGAE